VGVQGGYREPSRAGGADADAADADGSAALISAGFRIRLCLLYV
jgi:hypothetical protein